MFGCSILFLALGAWFTHIPIWAKIVATVIALVTIYIDSGGPVEKGDGPGYPYEDWY